VLREQPGWVVRMAVRTIANLSRPSRQAGQEAVEFALLLPVLLLVLVGILDLGRLFHAAITIANAAREGARYGMEHPTETGNIEAAVQGEAAGTGLDLSDPGLSTIAISCPDGACTSGLPLRVDVTYRVQLIVPGILGMTEVEVASYAEMRVP
jgi:Flp pilus assembly protein TadG